MKTFNLKFRLFKPFFFFCYYNQVTNDQGILELCNLTLKSHYKFIPLTNLLRFLSQLQRLINNNSDRTKGKDYVQLNDIISIKKVINLCLNMNVFYLPKTMNKQFCLTGDNYRK